MNEQFERENAFSDEIKKARDSGDLKKAICKCKEAITEFPDDNFFHKILGDIYLQAGNYELAGDEYIENLKLIGNQPKRFRSFIRFYKSFEKSVDRETVDKYKQKIRHLINNQLVSKKIAEYLVSFLGNDIIVDKELEALLENSNNDTNFHAIKSHIIKFEKKGNQGAITALIKYRIENGNHEHSSHIDRFLIQYLESINKYTEALALLQASNKLYENLLVKCTAFRLCRRLSDYSVVDRLYTIDNQFIEHADFNIQYELVYYFQSRDDEASLFKTLAHMRNNAEDSIPIARTLYNFYLTFNKFDEAQELYNHIQTLLKKANKKVNTVEGNEKQEESEQGVWKRLKGLVSEQEHNRQMIALRDLLKGFSHELGQPITNIRYAVQFEQMKIKRGLSTKEDISQLFIDILEQTERIGGLLDRFRPIVSSKSQAQKFDVKACIAKVFEDLETRLSTNHITYTLIGPEGIIIWGDPVQFSQVFYNLVLNSMQAMNSRGTIYVKITHHSNSDIKIVFKDNGPGIPIENTRKIFEPFFSTKDPTSGNGGEGLGLFIVWNILKMFDATIDLDRKYQHGAKFEIKIPLKKEQSNNEPSINN